MDTINNQIELHKKKLNACIDEIISVNDIIRKNIIKNNIKKEKEFL